MGTQCTNNQNISMQFNFFKNEIDYLVKRHTSETPNLVERITFGISIDFDCVPSWILGISKENLSNLPSFLPIEGKASYI